MVRSPLYLGDRGRGHHRWRHRPSGVRWGGWRLVTATPFLLHVDPLHEDIRSDQIDVGTAESQSVHTGLGKVWVLTGRTVYEVHPSTDEPTIVYELPRPTGLITSSLAVSEALWLGTSDGTLIRFDPFSGEERSTEIDSSIDGLVATEDGVWLTDIVAGTITRVDPETLDVVGEPISLEGVSTGSARSDPTSGCSIAKLGPSPASMRVPAPIAMSGSETNRPRWR